jgi:hypothetical protein
MGQMACPTLLPQLGAVTLDIQKETKTSGESRGTVASGIAPQQKRGTHMAGNWTLLTNQPPNLPGGAFSSDRMIL